MHKPLLLLSILLLLSACSQQTNKGPSIPSTSKQNTIAYSLEALDARYQSSRNY